MRRRMRAAETDQPGEGESPKREKAKKKDDTGRCPTAQQEQQHSKQQQQCRKTTEQPDGDSPKKKKKTTRPKGSRAGACGRVQVQVRVRESLMCGTGGDSDVRVRCVGPVTDTPHSDTVTPLYTRLSLPLFLPPLPLSRAPEAEVRQAGARQGPFRARALWRSGAGMARNGSTARAPGDVSGVWSCSRSEVIGSCYSTVQEVASNGTLE